jgi:phage tail protein X
MTTYITNDDDTLDYIVWKHYGKTAGVLEQVLNANRHLAGFGAVLPAGVKITLPDITPPANNQKIKIWQ